MHLKIFLTFLLFWLLQPNYAQLSQEQLELGYQFYNESNSYYPFKHYTDSVTVDPNSIEFAKDYFNYESIVSNYKPYWDLKISGYKQESLESIFDSAQIANLKKNLDEIEEVDLNREKLSSQIVFQKDRLKESFPIIQQAKDSSFYAFVYQDFSRSPMNARIVVQRKANKKWEYMGEIEVPLFNKKAFQEELQNYSSEYQIINDFLHGKKELISKKFIQVPDDVVEENFNAYLHHETWNNFHQGFNVEPIDFKVQFSKEDLRKIVIYLNSPAEGRIKERELLGNSKTISEPGFLKRREISHGILFLSKPYIFTNFQNEKFGIFYWEKQNGFENGSGNIVIYKLTDGVWEVLFSHMLWIS